jgi:hypothetical protein
VITATGSTPTDRASCTSPTIAGSTVE